MLYRFNLILYPNQGLSLFRQKQILEQPIFLNPHTKLNFNSGNPYFYCIIPRNISDKFAIAGDLRRFLQSSLISSRIFDEKLDFPTANHKRIYKLIMYFEWNHLLITETSQRPLLNPFFLLWQ